MYIVYIMLLLYMYVYPCEYVHFVTLQCVIDNEEVLQRPVTSGKEEGECSDLDVLFMSSQSGG